MDVDKELFDKLDTDERAEVLKLSAATTELSTTVMECLKDNIVKMADKYGLHETPDALLKFSTGTLATINILSILSTVDAVSVAFDVEEDKMIECKRNLAVKMCDIISNGTKSAFKEKE